VSGNESQTNRGQCGQPQDVHEHDSQWEARITFLRSRAGCAATDPVCVRADDPGEAT